MFSESFKLEGFFHENIRFVQCLLSDRAFTHFRPYHHEILSQDALLQLAAVLGKHLRVSDKKNTYAVLYQRFRTHVRSLKKTYLLLAESEEEELSLAAGSEWIVDNYPLLEQHINETLQYFRKGHDQYLPIIIEGPHSGYPRIYQLALELVQHTGAAINEKVITTFIEQAQASQHLTIRELWALPIMLRVVLIMNLAFLAEFNLITRAQRKTAHEVVERIFTSPGKSPSEAILSLAAAMKKDPNLWSAGHLVYLLRKLKDKGLAGALCVQWLHQKVSEMGYESQSIVDDVLHLHSANQISISNCFGSIRNITIENWADWFENVSILHRVLSQDPTGIYQISDFETRDRCRHKIEHLSKKVKREETEIAKDLIAFATQEMQASDRDQAHILGSIPYYLIDDGLEIFEKHIQYPRSYFLLFKRWVKQYIFPVWILSIFVVTIAILAIPVSILYSYQTSWAILIFCTFLFSLLASEVSLQILHWIAFLIKPPVPLPKIEEKEVVKAGCNTLIAVQTIFIDREKVRELVEDLEAHSLSNKESNIYFALIADLVEAKEKVLFEDQDLISYAEMLVSRLNQQSNRFFLIVRDREWSPTQQLFMGWERKRGKISQLNQLISGKSPNGVHLKSGDLAVLQKMKYVITLDEDTKIPPDTAIKLIATAAHPLNQPFFDAASGKIAKGYGIIQPSLAAPFDKASSSRFSKIFAEAPGTNPYTGLISNISQDLFNQGSYVGKGIYHVETFEKALKGWIPEGKILSHDLLEGLFLRAGFASDIVLLDSFPGSFLSFSKRLSRWARGDWQLLSWVFPKVENDEGNFVSNPLSLLGRWMILDNMRRSFVFIIAYLIIALAFTVLPGNPYMWVAMVFFSINLTFITTFLDSIILPIINPRSVVSIFYKLLQELERQVPQSILRTVFIPSLARVNGRAILLTLYRLFVSKRNLLEWVPTVFVEKKISGRLTHLYYWMLPELIVTIAGFALIYLYFPERSMMAIPLFTLWVLSPTIAFYIAQPPTRKIPKLTRKEGEKLLNIAWDTWRFYDEFITKETNDLVPDNIQLVPTTQVAMRTSPTNIGFQLLSTISAYDFGFIDATDMLSRLKRTFETLERMEKCRGHLYNWYNIETLEPLFPRYVSSVDSGNFISHCITLRTGLKKISHDLIFTPQQWSHLLSLSKIVKHEIDEEMPSRFISLCESLEATKSFLEKNQKILQMKDVKREFDSLKNSCSTTEILNIFHSLEELKSLNKKEVASEIHKEIELNTSYFFQAEIPNWHTLQEYCHHLLHFIHQIETAYKDSDNYQYVEQILECINKLRNQVKRLQGYSQSVLAMTHEVVEKITKFIHETDFQFLYSEKEKLLAIGYQVENNMLDPNYYSLLASEASITSLVAIAKGDVPSKHWFSLGRQLVKSPSGKALLSWSGSAFEYLMPLILVDPLPTTLLSHSCAVAVEIQKRYAAKHRHPWGISESGYAVTDVNGNYQYKAFGIPELGLKRGLENDFVLSPYSTFLALPIDMHSAMANIEELIKCGAYNQYGFKESIDYTPYRLTRREKYYILESHLAHHQGMILTSINNMLNKGILQKRFQNCALIRSVDVLLQEPFPYHSAAITLKRPKAPPIKKMEERRIPLERVVHSGDTAFPDTHLLSNGKLSEMIDNSGSGYLFYDRKTNLTRWKENLLSDDKGYYIFVRDLVSGEVWSLGFQPTKVKPSRYEVIFSPEKVTIHRNDFGINLTGEIVISTEGNMEIRKLTFKNESKRRRRLEITSYGEVTLTTKDADTAHPTFSNLFVESEFLKDCDALIFRRVPRSIHDKELFMGHFLMASACWEKLQWETDRRCFIGRNRDIHNPVAFQDRSPLSQSAGRTLDPIFSIRTVLGLESYGTESISFITTVADTKNELLNTLQSYFSPQLITRAFEMSLVKSKVEVRYEHIPMEKIILFQEFSKNLFFHLDPFRTHLEARTINRLQKPALWRFGISGDYPIVLIRLTEHAQLPLLKELLYCHSYLGKKCLDFDIVVLNEVVEGYRKEFHEELVDLLASISSVYTHTQQEKGKAFLLKIHDISSQEVTLFEAVAHVVFDSRDDKLVKRIKIDESKPESQTTLKLSSGQVGQKYFEGIQYYNGYGGFIDKGRGYRIFTEKDKVCPHPWSNVVGGNNFGFLVTETGGGYTWSDNSQENRLTPWNPDPVTDAKGEMIYIRDPQTGDIFSPLMPPAIVDHHFGYTKFRTFTNDLQVELTLSSSRDKKVKWWRLKIDNRSFNYKELEIYLYLEWALGTFGTKTTPHIVCGFDPKFKFVHATNQFNDVFSGRIVFLGSSEIIHSFTTSKREFIGRSNDPLTPVALQSKSKYAYLKNKISSGTDSIGALHHIMRIPPRQEKEILFYLAEEETLQKAKEASMAYGAVSHFDSEWKQLQDFWRKTTEKIEVETEDPSFNILMNGWLIYQALSCRLLAKTGFYQSSGAIGFRDQLQDSMSLLPIDPSITRNQVLLHASRQFIEGDVQHWWSPLSGKGIRTRFSDDYLWLPFTVLKYLEVTTDFSILDELAGFLEGESLKEDENEIYFTPRISSKFATIYDHCTLALDRALKFGAHGLPFIGCGDWNDGMNEIGIKGKGESVWLGWFLCDILHRFQKIAKQRNDENRARSYQEASNTLLTHIEKEGWDGEWYLRAYFDDGSPLGSKANDECKIDSLAQSWSVIFGFGDKERQIQAIQSVFKNLVKENSKVICLLTPPFMNTKLEPGYIKAYPTGVRENGAQYTHAAAWLILATTKLGQGNKAYELFRMINPINHTLDSPGVERYRGEPYVLAGDVYSESPYEGQAGWTWYTGAAGWLYQVGLENILGLKIRGDHFTLDPCIPSTWQKYKIQYQHNDVIFVIHVNNPDGVERGVKTITVDGKISPEKKIDLSKNTNGTIQVEVLMGSVNKA